LTATDGSLKTVASFLSSGDSTGTSTTTNSLVIANGVPLYLGTAQNTKVTADITQLQLSCLTQGQNFEIDVNPSGISTTALYVASTSSYMGVFTKSPTATLDVNGNANIRGNLTLTGTYLTISTSQTPSSSSAVGLPGQIAWDSGYVYVCVATNTWKRSALTTW